MNWLCSLRAAKCKLACVIPRSMRTLGIIIALYLVWRTGSVLVLLWRVGLRVLLSVGLMKADNLPMDSAYAAEVETAEIWVSHLEEQLVEKRAAKPPRGFASKCIQAAASGDGKITGDKADKTESR